MLYIVTGPPCVGKTHHIRTHAHAGDIIIDLDRIALALAAEGTLHHDYPDHIRLVARRARIAAIDAAIQMRSRHDIWIIDAAPSREQRAWYTRRQARFINLAAPADVIAARMSERPERNQALIRSLTGRQ